MSGMTAGVHGARTCRAVDPGDDVVRSSGMVASPRLRGFRASNRLARPIRSAPPRPLSAWNDVTNPRYTRILLKLSGEVLMGAAEKGGGGLSIDPDVIARVAAEIADVKHQGYELCVVVGGGNIFRGISGAARGMDRATGDYMGMLATVMNALAVQNALEQIGVETRVQSAIPMSSVCEPFIRRRAERHLEKGRIVIFAAGVGSPFFTTDSGAALRAAEMKCDALFKGTSVDGVYDADPKLVPTAKRFDTVDYGTVLAQDLRVMDASAIALCRDNDIPIVVFNIRQPGNLAAVLRGEGVSTVVQNNTGA